MSDIKIELAIKIGENKGGWKRTFKDIKRKTDEICNYKERVVLDELFDVIQKRLETEQDELLDIIRK